MKGQHQITKQRPLFVAFPFLSTALVGTLTTFIIATHASNTAQMASVGVCLSIVAAGLVSLIKQHAAAEDRLAELLTNLQPALSLAGDSELFEHYSEVSRGLMSLARQPDPLLREFAMMKLANVSEQIASLATGEVVFTSTESWRTAYERLLQSHGLGEYLSVGWVKSADYWRDMPGRQSLRLNYELAARGLRIERFIILRDSLWPPGDLRPSREVFDWMEEQFQRGLMISVARESELFTEPDLLCDFGIYGARAVGIHELDEHARTLRFMLYFDRQRLQQAHDRWSRLSLYGNSFCVLLDRTPPDG